MKIFTMARNETILLIMSSFVLLCSCGGNRYLSEFQTNIPPTGRAMAIDIDKKDENFVFVASETGGLFKSQDAGINWESVRSLPPFKITDVKVSPKNSDVIVVSSQEHFRTNTDGGIWVSNDKGISWKHVQLQATSSNRCTKRISAYSISFVDDSPILLVGTDCGLFKSTDNGITWSHVPVDATNAILPEKKQDAIISVLSIDEDFIIALNRVRPWQSNLYITKDGGLNWSKLQGFDFTNYGNHAIAKSPINDDHIFITTGKDLLYLSEDSGANWEKITTPEIDKQNRQSFIQCVVSTSLNPNEIDIYFGNGIWLYKKSFISRQNELVELETGWKQINLDHADPTHIGFGKDGITPKIMVSDAGLNQTSDMGLSWKMSGKLTQGYNALQITEVTGHQISGYNGSKNKYIYFGTQDNSMWSTDFSGNVWDKSIGTEGYYIELERHIRQSDNNKITYHDAGWGKNIVSDVGFANHKDWTNPPNYIPTSQERMNGFTDGSIGAPAFINKNKYVQVNTYPKNMRTLFLTDDLGVNWTPRFQTNYEVASLPFIARGKNGLVIFLAIRTGFFYKNNQRFPRYELIQIDNLELNPSHKFVNHTGSLGTFPTQFAWYEVFGVNKNNSEHIIIPDTQNDKILETRNGGITWTENTTLKELLTNNGQYLFSNGEFSLVDIIDFNPCNPDHIVIGTSQNGLFHSHNSGQNWYQIEGTKEIPFISDVFFDFDESLVISSYGRGLFRYKHNISCKKPQRDWLRDPPDWIDGPNTDFDPVGPIALLEVAKPYIQINGGGTVSNTFKIGETLQITGLNFEDFADENIEIKIDGKKTEDDIIVDDYGNFIFSHKVNENIGNHLVEVIINNSVIDVTRFLVVLNEGE